MIKMFVMGPYFFPKDRNYYEKIPSPDSRIPKVSKATFLEINQFNRPIQS